jgi:putative transferase (TIGR04331 family)
MKYKLIINHIEKKDFNSKNLLFLNPLIPKANLLQKKKFKIVDNIWKKRDTLYSDSRYVNKLTNLHLKDLKNFLNKYHNKNYSFKFWKIHLEVWLLYFITINYLSWKTLKLAFKNNKIGEVLLYLDTRDSSVNTFDDFFRLTIDLSWRGQMYKKILKNFQKKKQILIN